MQTSTQGSMKREAKLEDQTKRPDHPVVTITREHGAFDDELAPAVAAKLGFEVWDRNLVEALAKEAGVSPSVLESMGERPKNALEDMVDGILLGIGYSDSNYVSALRKVVGDLAEKGEALIVGRAAGFVLDHESHFRVRFVCPLATRVRRLTEEGLSPHDALHEIRRIDHARESFVHRYFKRSVSDPAEYDLVINTARLSNEDAANIIASAYWVRFGAQRSS